MSKNNKQKKSRSKRHLIILAVCLVLLTTVFIFMSFIDGPNKVANRSDFRNLRQSVISIRDDSVANNVTWEDASSCTIVEPRLYGDKTEYNCTTRYERSVKVASQQDIDQLVNTQLAQIKELSDIINIQTPHIPTFITDGNDQFHANQIGSSQFDLGKEYSYDQNCSFEYKLTNVSHKRGILRNSIRCFVSTEGVYLPNVERL